MHKLSTDPEEIFVEIIGPNFTKLLQLHTYNTLHTSAAYAESVTDERVTSKRPLMITHAFKSWPNTFAIDY